MQACQEIGRLIIAVVVIIVCCGLCFGLGLGFCLGGLCRRSSKFLRRTNRNESCPGRLVIALVIIVIRCCLRFCFHLRFGLGLRSLRSEAWQQHVVLHCCMLLQDCRWFIAVVIIIVIIDSRLRFGLDFGLCFCFRSLSKMSDSVCECICN